MFSKLIRGHDHVSLILALLIILRARVWSWWTASFVFDKLSKQHQHSTIDFQLMHNRPRMVMVVVVYFSISLMPKALSRFCPLCGWIGLPMNGFIDNQSKEHRWRYSFHAFVIEHKAFREAGLFVCRWCPMTMNSEFWIRTEFVNSHPFRKS